MLTLTHTANDYRAAFQAERVREYPVVDAFEQRCGYAIDRARLESAAKVLACPLKKSPPNWQHGRVLYAAARKYLKPYRGEDGITVLDIGTAKGFSALCLRWAMDDSNCVHDDVTSVDIMDPNARVGRNTIAEVDGLLTLAETLAPWPAALGIQFVQSTGLDWLMSHPERVHIAFVDGSHNGPVVLQEAKLLAARQQPGDLAIFDDVDRLDIAMPLASMHKEYQFDYLHVLPKRHYAIGVRR